MVSNMFEPLKFCFFFLNFSMNLGEPFLMRGQNIYLWRNIETDPCYPFLSGTLVY